MGDVESAVGPIDVVIANAGYGVEGIFEETALSEMRAQFATNVFGVAATLQAALPYMRQRKAGHLMAVTSMGGLMAVPRDVCLLCEQVRRGRSAGEYSKRGRGVRRSRHRDPIRTARIKASGNQLGNPSSVASSGRSRSGRNRQFSASPAWRQSSALKWPVSIAHRCTPRADGTTGHRAQIRPPEVCCLAELIVGGRPRGNGSKLRRRDHPNDRAGRVYRAKF